jgi:uncharacterized protein (DUF2132 family)
MVNTHVRRGTLVPPSAQRCADCGGPAAEYDHYLGYAPEHKLDVQPVCRSCHLTRTWKSSHRTIGTFCFRADPETRVALSFLIEKTGRSRTELIRRALRSYGRYLRRREGKAA